MIRTVLLSMLPWQLLLPFAGGAALAVFWFADYAGTSGDLHPRLQVQADMIATAVSAALPTPAFPVRLMVLPLANDPTRYLRGRIVDETKAGGRYPIAEFGAMGQLLLEQGIDLPHTPTLNDARRIAASMPAEQFLWGEVEAWPLDPSVGAGLTASFVLFDKQGAVLWRRSLRYRDLQSEPRAGGAARWIAACLGGAGLFFAMPYLLGPLTRRLLARRSNAAAGVLAVVLAAAAVCATAVLAAILRLSPSPDVMLIAGVLSVIGYVVYLPVIARRQM